MKKKITEDTTLAEILKHPEAQEILVKYNLPCLGCPFVKAEVKTLTLGDICRMYGIDLRGLLKELNEKLN